MTTRQEHTESITLYYRDGRSDKVYQAEIVATGNGLYVVNFAFGRRGSTLQTGTKTSAPVPYAKANTIYNKLVASKMAKGYTPGADGTPYQGASPERRQTGIACQLLNAVDAGQVADCLASDTYVAQEKFDGRRLLVRKQGSEVIGSNRQGLETGLPTPIADAVRALPVACILDGEAVGDVLHVFDLLAGGGFDLRHRPYAERLAELAKLIGDNEHLRLVPTAVTVAEKRALFAQVQEAGREGIVFKDRTAPYTPGRPATGGSQLKFKFYETASCLVTARNVQRSVALSLLDGATTVPCGNVTIPPNHAIPAVGQVVEVRYLYAFPQSNVLYQPVYLGVREDIARDDCTCAQLKFKAA